MLAKPLAFFSFTTSKQPTAHNAMQPQHAQHSIHSTACTAYQPSLHIGKVFGLLLLHHFKAISSHLKAQGLVQHGLRGGREREFAGSHHGLSRVQQGAPHHASGGGPACRGPRRNSSSKQEALACDGQQHQKLACASVARVSE